MNADAKRIPLLSYCATYLVHNVQSRLKSCLCLLIIDASRRCRDAAIATILSAAVSISSIPPSNADVRRSYISRSDTSRTVC